MLLLDINPVVVAEQLWPCCLLDINPVVVADQLWDTHPGAGVPAAQCCHQLYAGQRGLVRHRL